MFQVKRKSVAFAQTVDQIFDNIENKLLRKKVVFVLILFRFFFVLFPL